jgi:hypothetical protein
VVACLASLVAGHGTVVELVSLRYITRIASGGCGKSSGPALACAFAAKAASPAVLPQRAIGSCSVQRRAFATSPSDFRVFARFLSVLPQRTNCKLRIVVDLLRAMYAKRPFFLALLRLNCLELRGKGRVARHEVSAEVFVPSHDPSAPTMSMAYLVGIFNSLVYQRRGLCRFIIGMYCQTVSSGLELAQLSSRQSHAPLSLRGYCRCCAGAYFVLMLFGRATPYCSSASKVMRRRLIELLIVRVLRGSLLGLSGSEVDGFQNCYVCPMTSSEIRVSKLVLSSRTRRDTIRAAGLDAAAAMAQKRACRGPCRPFVREVPCSQMGEVPLMSRTSWTWLPFMPGLDVPVADVGEV